MRRAFTLLEIIAAMGLMSLVAAVSVYWFVSGTDALVSATARAQGADELHVAYGLLADDFEGLITQEMPSLPKYSASKQSAELMIPTRHHERQKVRYSWEDGHLYRDEEMILEDCTEFEVQLYGKLAREVKKVPLQEIPKMQHISYADVTLRQGGGKPFCRRLYLERGVISINN